MTEVQEIRQVTYLFIVRYAREKQVSFPDAYRNVEKWARKIYGVDAVFKNFKSFENFRRNSQRKVRVSPSVTSETEQDFQEMASQIGNRGGMLFKYHGMSVHGGSVEAHESHESRLEDQRFLQDIVGIVRKLDPNFTIAKLRKGINGKVTKSKRKAQRRS